ncbi:MAG: radical SAM protein [Deltaproteobacteria bacterium]|nr:radical SAM protein [Deltaproteobacteria bacterium]MBM4323436.1 radical SAM protein [Deltaproteobacteria bacterium]MBM4348014.1 radical SAM protein [Deltaproteobacteria bacterium]
MTKFEYPILIFSDSTDKIFDHPDLKIAGRSGDRIVLPDPSELVPLPRGSQLFSLPGRIPIGWEGESFKPLNRIRIGKKEVSCTGVAAFLPPGYVRTLLPATQLSRKAPILPLWAYSSVGWKDGKFWATGIIVDPNPHWNPKYFGNDLLLKKKVALSLEKESGNRLLRQLARCAMEYHCFAAKNVFFRRWECPLPTSPSCNAACIGCISLQPSECCLASMERIKFVPTPDEVLGVALPHLQEAKDAIVSFGQGCEGEPLMQWRVLEKSIRQLRERTDRGTINLNTNGSLPERVATLCDAGLDSLRVTMNSPHKKYYDRYHKPKRYAFNNVVNSLVVAKEKGIYTSINLLVFPGFTDREEEIEGLIRLIGRTKLNLIQMRNLNIDPDLYLEAMGRGTGIGLSKMMEILKKEFPRLQFGYFNRTKENFYPHG